jgi:hypothetical protein
MKDVGRDLRQALITVPSCDEHNSRRSRDDEYAMVIVATYLGTNRVARSQFAKKCIRALKGNAALVRRVFDSPRNVLVNGSLTVAIDVDRERFDRVMQQNCRALYYHDHSRKLVEPLLVFSPDLLQPDLQSDPGEAHLAFTVRQILKPRPKLGANPEAFSYQSFSDPNRLTAFRLEFYEGFSVYAVARHRRDAETAPTS